MPEYIFELGDALYNEEAGEAVFKPKIVSKLVRCKDCKYYAGEGMYCANDIIVQFDHFYCYYGERKTDNI